LEVLPVCTDYTHALVLPQPTLPSRSTAFFFPGSTIGNFEPHAAIAFLRRLANAGSTGDYLIVGVDLVKNHHVLRQAYNDSQGITAAFNLNVLQRANEEFSAGFSLAHFQHRAIYNEEQQRIEMRIASTREQSVRVDGETIRFALGEEITTEHSYKYLPETFAGIARQAGWRPLTRWTDSKHWFSVVVFQCA